MRDIIRTTILAAALLASALSHAGNQLEEQMSHSVRAALSKAVSDQTAPFLAFATTTEARTWLDAMSSKLERRMPDRALREDFLVTVHYEAKRAGLDPQMVLGLIQVESAFRKYAVSTASARGLMQVMPFWTDVIGSRDTNLFHLRTNLRFGCASAAPSCVTTSTSKKAIFIAHWAATTAASAARNIRTWCWRPGNSGNLCRLLRVWLRRGTEINPAPPPASPPAPQPQTS